MAREIYVSVELIKNPTVKRQMNVNSFRMNQKKWRLQDGQTLEQAMTVKKKVVEPAVSKAMFVGSTIQMEDEFSNVDSDLLKKPETPFVEVKETNEPTGLIDGLRAEYETKTGKKADGRWNVERLTQKINEAN
jgi:hypothetical protein